MDAVSANLKREVFIDIERELCVTRQVLALVPEAKLGWKIHPKSMSVGQLALHAVNVLDWL